MFRVMARAAFAALLVLPRVASADPINAEGHGLVHIDVHFSAAISSVQKLRTIE